ncbi:uncharacterized protein SAPINGB_P005759 [Magnusiomyces paraingens]|uniref:Major facilitator superfamily (MFS) profile domain-containing protein n=1 Tax=Magnusiomyces paraingens TaxID=2606893 RepID=A0A5E8C3M3_9ASCO|nr:uncharacterized protein SAPINGB_P005759 [Saprochaete ingens]VVT57565.1 unnamed protein product [Saprochaete ingens]
MPILESNNISPSVTPTLSFTNAQHDIEIITNPKETCGFTDAENLHRVHSLATQNLTRIISESSDFAAYQSLNEEIIQTLREEENLSVDATEQEDATEHPYTIFSKTEVICIAIEASCAAFFSTISVPIYLSALTDFANEFHVSTERINLTVTVFTIVQAVIPAVWGAIADFIGRRPVIVMCLVIYIGANIGLAFAKNYGFLIGFRILQAAGIASTVAVGSGIVGDITDRKNRGFYIGIYSGLSMVGSAIGPLIGGALAATLGWRSIFWFLVIAAGVTLVFLLVMLPETSRKIAGNGSIKPSSWINKSPYMSLRKHFVKESRAETLAPETVLPPSPIKLHRTMQLFLEKDVIIILLPNAIHYASWFMLITAQSTLLTKHYDFSTLQLGLSYVANGGGSVLGSLVGGKVMNLAYNHEVKRFRNIHGNEEEISPQNAKFNIHRARLWPLPIVSSVHIAATLIFGWSIQYHVHYAVPIVFTAFVSFASMFSFSLSSTLMVDLFPSESSSAAAAVNLSRGTICAVGISLVDRMDQAMGTGGTFSLMAGLMLLSWALNFYEIKNGPKYHQERLKKKQDLEKIQLEEVHIDEKNLGNNDRN